MDLPPTDNGPETPEPPEPQTPRSVLQRYRLALLAAMLVIAATIFALRPTNLPQDDLGKSPSDYRILICRYARKANLPEVFVHKVVLAESSGRPWAVSRVNAKGLMQILPAAETDVLRELKRTERGNLFNPDYNLLIGTTYLRMLTDRFDGDAYLVLGAYHMGPTRVARYRAANPGISGKELVDRFAGPQTRDYCAKILQGEELRLPVTRLQPPGGSSSPPAPATQHN